MAKIYSDKDNEFLKAQELADQEEASGVSSDELGGHKGVKIVNLTEEVKKAFLEYSMSVIVSRAIPDVRDGMKPVHRRIIYAMNDLGIVASRPHKKSARIVGDVMAKYHPHGDSSIYEALVRLAQPFASRYPLVDGHGNFGSIDGDNAAAMRYTEARLARISNELVRDIDKNTIDFVPNYDGEEKEPVVLPARIPNILINGSSGIAVGMATNIPPHNLSEVIDATLAILENPEITETELMNDYIFGPDFPTGGYILGKSGIRKAFETGQGPVTIRSKTHIEEMDNGKKRIIVTEIPYQVNKTVMIEKIADLVKNKVIEGISDLRDESNREGIRVVIELKRDAIPEVLLNQLFKLTQLQVNYSINMLSLVNGEPKVLGIKPILNEYLKHQEEVIRRRTQFDLKNALDRQHILLGLSIAGQNIDEVIKIIRESKTTEMASNTLKETFNLSDAQVNAILQMRLQRLTGIEQDKIDEELKELEIKIADFRDILENRDHLLSIIKEEMLDIKNRFGDKRRTEITLDSYDIEDEDLIPQEDILITLTQKGYIKRLTTDTFKAQNRGGKGIKGMTTSEDDNVELIIGANTHKDIKDLESQRLDGLLRGYQIPEFSRTSKGIPVVNLISAEKQEKVKVIISIDSYDEEHQLTFITKQGIVKRVSLDQFESVRQNGKIAIELREEDELIDVKLTDGNAEILIAANNGKLARFNESDVRSMGRTATGVKGIEMDEGVYVVGAATNQEGDYVLTISENGYGKMTLIPEYRLTQRGSKGVGTMNTTDKVGMVSAMKVVNGEEDLLITTDRGIVIRTSLTSVARSGRNTQGVRIIRLDEGQKVASIAIVEPEENEEVETPVEVENIETEVTETTEETNE